jgi:hypothetical protein
MTSDEKKSRIYGLLDSLDKEQVSIFMSWAHPRLTWYVEARIEYSESQLDEIIARLEEITKKG